MKPEANTNLIGALIKKNREKLGLTVFSFAIALDINYNTLSKIENGYQMPSIHLMSRILDNFNLSYTEFFDEKETEEIRKAKIRTTCSMLERFEQSDINCMTDIIKMLRSSYNV